MSDDYFGTEFGPSTPGALNLVSGDLYGASGMSPSGHPVQSDPGIIGTPNARGIGTVYDDQDPYDDGCSDRSATTLRMTGTNIGNLLNTRHVTWGWFEGGFAPTSRANPDHLPPASLAEVGRDGRANHQYDLSWFGKALRGGRLPAVSFLKAPGYADGHAGYSDPLDEQHYLVRTINAIERSRYWRSTAIMLTYDDSDGWYDHVMPPIVNPSADPLADRLNGIGVCGHGQPLAGHQDRCGYRPRLPFLLISPYARRNYVDGALTDQTSVLRFIEDNWLGGERIGHGSFDTLDGMFDWRRPRFRPLILNPRTGEPMVR